MIYTIAQQELAASRITSATPLEDLHCLTFLTDEPVVRQAALDEIHARALDEDAERATAITASGNDTTGPHFCAPACYDTHATPWDRAGDAAETCADLGHIALYPDLTPELTRAHVYAHLVDDQTVYLAHRAGDTVLHVLADQTAADGGAALCRPYARHSKTLSRTHTTVPAMSTLCPDCRTLLRAHHVIAPALEAPQMFDVITPGGSLLNAHPLGKIQAQQWVHGINAHGYFTGTDRPCPQDCLTPNP